jgi:hypothetical protein
MKVPLLHNGKLQNHQYDGLLSAESDSSDIFDKVCFYSQSLSKALPLSSMHRLGILLWYEV